jgi:hypothetical protein
MNYAPFCRKQLDALWCDGSGRVFARLQWSAAFLRMTQSKHPLQRFLAVLIDVDVALDLRN